MHIHNKNTHIKLVNKSYLIELLLFLKSNFIEK